jgi:adenylosuccinate synthase
VPSGILNPKSINVIGHGVVAYLPGLFEEIEKLEAAGVNTSGRILLSDRAHVLLDMHREVRASVRGVCVCICVCTCVRFSMQSRRER